MTKPLSVVLVLTGLVGLVGGCNDDLNECPSVALVITSPADGVVLSEANDTSPGDPGVQIDVSVRVDGVAPGADVTLAINGDVQPQSGTVSSSGVATFSSVTVPRGDVTIRASAIACSNADETVEVSDEIAITVDGDVDCQLSIREEPIPTDFFNVPVLNTTNDTDAAAPGFQANVDVQTSAGFEVEVFVLDVDTGTETSAGTKTAGETGVGSFPFTLAEGRQSLRATCRSLASAATGASMSKTVVVDVTRPACAIVAPPSGEIIVPAMDEDDEEAGIQVTLRGAVTGTGDVAGEPTTFTVGAGDVAGTAVDAGGESSAVATFNAPGTATIQFTATDHAQNPCAPAASRDVTVEVEGCEISHVGPTGTVSTDEDPDTVGVQTTVSVQVGAECVGQTASTTCSAGDEVMAVVPAGGETSFEVTICATTECDIDGFSCETRVSTAGGIETSAGATFDVDTQPPTAILDPVAPDVTCSATIEPSQDVAPETDGMQVQVRLLATDATTRRILLTNDVVTDLELTLDGTGNAIATLAPGLNSFVGMAADEFGNEVTLPACGLTLADLAVAITSPADGALLAADDDEVPGGDLDITVCGTVSDAASTVEVTAGGAGPLPATVTGGGAWCIDAPVSLPDGTDIVIRADATASTGTGSASVTVDVDTTPPDAVSDLDAVAVARTIAELSWTAPAGVDSYLVKVAEQPLDAGNFDSTGRVVPPPSPPGSGGATEAVDVTGLRPGIEYFFGVAAFDSGGNRSVAFTTIPVTTSFTASGLIVSPGDPPTVASTDAQQYGVAVAGGDLNADGFSDVVVSAALGGGGRVYVYLGGPSGIATSPDFRIRPSGGVFFGANLATLDWNGDGVTDLAVSDPFQNSSGGRIIIFYGGETFDPIDDGLIDNLSQTLATASTCGPTNDQPCGALIQTDNAGDLAAARMGPLARTRFDDDARDDLVIGVPLAGASDTGGALVVLGGSTSQTITVSESGITGGAEVFFAEFPSAPTTALYGSSVFTLGPISFDDQHDIAISPTEFPAVADVGTVFIFRGRNHPGTSNLEPLSFAAGDLSVVGPIDVSFGRFVGRMSDITGDDVADIVITARRANPSRVYVIPGDATGSNVAVDSLDPLVIRSPAGVTTFGMGLANNADDGGADPVSPAADVDGDGIADLVIAGGIPDPRLFVWYGGTLTDGMTVSTDSADYVFASPAGFTRVNTLRWVGDIDADGLSDLTWADDNSSETNPGEMEVLR